MSIYSAWVDAAATTLQGVAGLTSATVHKYTPASPERLTTDGRRHLAIWPVSEAEVMDPMTIGGSDLVVTFEILVWEPTAESELTVADETAMAAFLDVLDAIRTALHDDDFRVLSTSWLTKMRGATIGIGGGIGGGLTRYIAVQVEAHFGYDST